MTIFNRHAFFIFLLCIMHHIRTTDSYGVTEDGKLFYKKNEDKMIIFENHAYQNGPLARLSFAYDRLLQDPLQKTVFLQLLAEYTITTQGQAPKLHASPFQNNQNTQILTKRKHEKMISMYARHKNNHHQRQTE